MDNRTKILKTSKHMIAKHGYYSTGLNEILKKAQIPKGSFYYYFPSKQDLLLEVIDSYMQDFDDLFDSYMGNELLDPITRIKAFFEQYKRILIHKDYKGGFPLFNLAIELSDSDEKIRQKLSEIFRLVILKINYTLREAYDLKLLTRESSGMHTSEYIFGAWQGAIALCRITHSVEPYDTFMRMTFSRYLEHMR